MIRCAMFDFGHVLMPFSTQKWYDFVRSCQRPHPGAVKLEDFFGLEFVRKFDLGEIRTVEFISRSKSALGLDVSDGRFLFEYTDNIMNSDRKMLAIVRALKQNGLKLAVVSNINTCHYWHVKMAYPKVFADFDFLMLSFQHGFMKPDHRMWEVPARELGVLPEECFFVEDLKVNVVEFMKWSKELGASHHYDVADDKFCPNGRLEVERSRLMFKMMRLGLLNSIQASQIMQITF